jgi:ketosteroid isomerase-like protein
MRHLACIFLSLCPTAMWGSVTEAQKLSPTEQEVVNVNKARMGTAANRDMAAWTRYVAEDCVFSTDGGTVSTKAQMLAHYKKGPRQLDRALDPGEQVVHVYGDTAILNYLATNHEQFGNSALTTEQRRTETFVKRDGSWLLVAIQWDNLPINRRKPVVVEGRSYKEYVGECRSRLEDDIETISVVDGKLWSQTADAKGDCLPAGGDTFFYQDDLGSFTFSRDAEGQVTGYIYRRFVGQEICSKKIK